MHPVINEDLGGQLCLQGGDEPLPLLVRHVPAGRLVQGQGRLQQRPGQQLTDKATNMQPVWWIRIQTEYVLRNLVNPCWNILARDPFISSQLFWWDVVLLAQAPRQPVQKGPTRTNLRPHTQL